jgi:hypothetical protein
MKNYMHEYIKNMDDHYIKSTKVNEDNNNTNKITSVTNLDISTSSYINEIAELQSLISEYDKLNAISNKSKIKINVNNNKIDSVSSNNKKSQVDKFQSLLTNLINKHNII